MLIQEQVSGKELLNERMKNYKKVTIKITFWKGKNNI